MTKPEARINDEVRMTKDGHRQIERKSAYHSANMGESSSERLDEIYRADASSVAYRIEALQALLRDFPDSGAAWALLGDELTDVSRFAEAEQALRRAINLLSPPTLSHVYCSLGKLFQHRGDPSRADGWFRMAIALRPDDAQASIYQGGMWARLGRLEEAEDSHRRATRCTTGCIYEAHHNLGLVLRAQTRYDEASACFAAAIELRPQYREARLAKRDVERAVRARWGADRS
jgi:tetratricopeptide (TPR) repeat protein